MIHIRELGDDFYEHDEENYCIKGRHSGKVYTLGDRIMVEVVKADLQKKQLDYRIVMDITVGVPESQPPVKSKSRRQSSSRN
jgi:ribonuclease R